MVDEARAEARRFTTAALPHVRAGAAIVGLEPSCLFSLKDEFQTMGLSAEAGEIGAAAHLLSQFLLNHRSETGSTPLKAVDRHVHVHGHCHQKSFGSFQPEIELLNSIPKLKVTTLESSCCGMAGAFGYNQDTYDVSLKMAELNLLPSVRKARDTDIIAACGFSCRHQIKDGAGRTATHPVHILRDALA
jgi:Fe-S oxidoreductase